MDFTLTGSLQTIERYLDIQQREAQELFRDAASNEDIEEQHKNAEAEKGDEKEDEEDEDKN